MFDNLIMSGTRFECTEFELTVRRVWGLAVIVLASPCGEVLHPSISMDS